jgi:F-type H+-transporting ATPase subunit b
MEPMLLAEEHNPLLPVASEIFVGTIAFGVVLWVIWKFIAPRFEEIYKERAEAIEGGIAKAEQAQEQASAALEHYQSQLADARGEASQIREEARAQGAAILVEMREQAQAESARLVAAAQAHIEAERAAAVASLHSEVGTLASQLAEKIIGESMTDDERQRRVVDRFLADLETQGSDR